VLVAALHLRRCQPPGGL